MNETQVVRAAYALCKALHKNGADVLGREIADVVNKHSIGSAAAGLGVAWLPGAGATAALAASAGIVWSMYFRINNKIGVSLSKNILKSVGTAIGTNLAAAAVSSVAISTVASLFPGLGNVAASAVMAGVTYSLTWASGLIYLKVLTHLAEHRTDLSSVDEETLKRTAKDIMANEDIKSVLKEAKAQYKQSKDSGEINKDATVDVEEDAEGDELSDGVDALGETANITDRTREEELFLKRAKRFAASDGEISPEHMSSLVEFAEKLGIDEIRKEELIEESY